jgi:hypothetical protein
VLYKAAYRPTVVPDSSAVQQLPYGLEVEEFCSIPDMKRKSVSSPQRADRLWVPIILIYSNKTGNGIISLY